MAKPSRKGAPPKPDPDSFTTLNLRVAREFKRELKQFALDHDQTLTRVLVEGFELLRRQAKPRR